MRISDWSSDVCSSDLPQIGGPDLPRFVMHLRECGKGCGLQRLYDHADHHVESKRSNPILRNCGRAKEGADEQGCDLRVCLTQQLTAKLMRGETDRQSVG